MAPRHWRPHTHISLRPPPTPHPTPLLRSHCYSDSICVAWLRRRAKAGFKIFSLPTQTLPSCANLFHLEVDFIISFEPRPDREVNHFDRPCLKPLQPKPLILSIFGAKGGRSKSLLALCGSGVNPEGWGGGACRVPRPSLADTQGCG